VASPPRTLWERLFDDAAMFPPGNASPGAAIGGHRRIRASWYDDLVGPLLVPATRWDEFTEAYQEAGRPAVPTTMIGSTVLPPTAAPGPRVLGFEVPVADVPLPDTDGRGLAAEISLSAAGDRVIAAIAATAPHLRGDFSGRWTGVVKFRTGGTSADEFPTEDVLADFINRVCRAGAPFKLTAGLHHAIRHTDPTTGFEHHGFLNVIVATKLGASGASGADVAACLATRDVDEVAAQVRGMTQDEVREVRWRFTSFGCCGVEDPIGDLVALRLLDPDEKRPPRRRAM